MNRSHQPKIDPTTWQVNVLPLPKRYARGAAYGFCGGFAAGIAETARATVSACWWPNNSPSLLLLEGYKDLGAGSAGGDLIPGHWRKGSSGGMGAVTWQLRDGPDGNIVAIDLHDSTFERSWATAAGGGAVVGVGTPKGKLGTRDPDVGLIWLGSSETPKILRAAGDVLLLATDGSRFAGSVNGRAALWLSDDGDPISLATERMPASEVRVIDGDLQAGVAFRGMRARAVVWRGSAESLCDVTPSSYQTGRIYGGSNGYQVGFVRERDTTKNGSTAIDNRAALWQGTTESFFDLNSVLSSDEFNSSLAYAIEILTDEVRICGQVSRYEVSDAGTPAESHVMPVAHPALWTARLI